jgi:ABC-type methionine transport system ATPase subunit
LQTHNIALTAPLADYVVSIHDGRVFAEGSAKDVLKHDKTIAAEAKEDKEALKKSSEEVDATPTDGEAAPKTDGKLIVAEEIAIGAVGWAPGKSDVLHSGHASLSIVWRYLKAMGGDHLVLFCLGYLSFDFMHEIFWSAQPWYLGYWANQYNDPTIHEVPVVQ